MMKPTLNIIVALPCEARPVLDAYHLKKRQDPYFAIYADSDQKIQLIVSGVGRVKAAAAMTYLHQLSGGASSSFYLNLGIAGSGEYALGDVIICNKLESAHAKTFYPLPRYYPNVSPTCLLTTDYPVAKNELATITAVDMEAHGFFAAATLFVSQEQVAVVKIISDTAASRTAHIKPAFVTDLITKQIAPIRMVIDDLLVSSENEANLLTENPYFALFLQRWHFSQYQQYQLKEYLRRWQVMLPDMNPLQEFVAEHKAAEIITTLEKKLSVAHSTKAKF